MINNAEIFLYGVISVINSVTTILFIPSNEKLQQPFFRQRGYCWLLGKINLGK